LFEIATFSFFGYGNFFLRNFLRFFGESMVQNHKIFPVKKTRNKKNIIVLLNPYFLDIVSAFKFFQVFARNDIDLLDQIEHQGNFLKLFICQRIKNSSTGYLSVSSL